MKYERISALRNAIQVVAERLSEHNVGVTQSGLDAFVELGKDGNPKRINLPQIPDDASDELADAIQGYLDAKVANVLFSDNKLLMSLDETKGSKISHLANLLENVRVEKNMVDKYVGSKIFLGNLLSFNTDKTLSAVQSKESDISALMPIVIHALGGNEIAQGYIDSCGGELRFIYEGMRKYQSEINAMGSTQDAVDLAEKILKENQEQDDDKSQDDQSENGDGENDDKEQGENGQDDSESQDKDDNQDGDENTDEQDESQDDEQKDDKPDGKSDKSNASGSKFKASEVKDDIVSKALHSFAENGEVDEISKASVESAKSLEYLVFSKDDDKIVKQIKGHINHEDTLFLDHINNSVGLMSKELERAFIAQNQAVWERGLKRGKLDGSSLSKIIVNNDVRVFKRKTQTQAKNSVVSILIDASGSMYHQKMVMALQTGYALSRTLTRLDIPHEILCFTTNDVEDYKIDRIKDAEEKYGVKYARYDDLRIYEIKPFGAKFNNNHKLEMAKMLTLGRSILFQNVDGESVEIAYRRLLAQKEQNKILLVLSDGSPVCTNSCGYTTLHNHLKKVVSDIEKSEVKIVGIGIMTSSVREFYTDHIVVNRIGDLTSTALQQLKKFLLN